MERRAGYRNIESLRSIRIDVAQFSRKMEALNMITVENLTAEDDGNGMMIMAYTGFDDKKITVPSRINGKVVTGISNSVFKNCRELEQVIIQENCRYIGSSVFEGCESLRKVSLPSSLLEVGDQAFRSCSELEEITLPSGVKCLGQYIFQNCIKLTRVILPDGLECIPAYAFQNSGIKEIELPESLKVISESAFANSELCQMCLPKNLQMIQYHAFYQCRLLREITIFSNVRIFANNCFSERGGRYKLIVFCEAGSVALSQLRRYDWIVCKEIEPLERNVQQNLGYTMMFIFVDRNSSEAGLREWAMKRGECRVAQWSWHFDPFKPWVFRIEKYMSENEKNRIESIFRGIAKEISNTKL